MNKLIIDTLAPLNVPVSFLHYTGVADTYITFFEVTQESAFHADDLEQASRHSFQVDIWTKTDYTELAKQVKELLGAVGFYRSSEAEMYENDTKIYHKVIRFNYVK